YLKSFDARKTYKHWLTGIAVNCFKDIRLKEQRYAPLDDINEASYSPRLEENSDFFNLIQPLDDNEKIMFTLKYVYDYRTQEIADVLDLKTGTVKSKISRALEKLK
ncbi:MAG: RNA polymerase sigma factor, partial [Porticoccaceae bacterium]|nr:RNA polymerase sigma factor [Porticoccaceae bacterium]